MVKRKLTKLKMRKRQRKLKEAIHPNEVPLLVLKVHLHSLTLTAHWCCSRAARALEQGKYCMCLCLSDLSERKQISLVKTFNFLILYLGMVLGSLAKPIMKMTAKWVSFYDQVHLDGVSQPQASESHRDFGLCIHRLIYYRPFLFSSPTEDEDGLSLTKDNSHNSSFELTSSTLPSYQPVSRATGKGLSAAMFRSPSPCFFRPSFLSSASKVSPFF